MQGPGFAARGFRFSGIAWMPLGMCRKSGTAAMRLRLG